MSTRAGRRRRLLTIAHQAHTMRAELISLGKTFKALELKLEVLLAVEDEARRAVLAIDKGNGEA